jgi:hypothetical protein
MSDLPALPSQLQERIKTSISSTLQQHPEGITPKQLFDTLAKDFNRQDMQEVLTAMYQDDHSITVQDRKLTLCTH